MSLQKINQLNEQMNRIQAPMDIYEAHGCLCGLLSASSDIDKQVQLFLDGGGSILGCGTCLQSRKNNEPQICKLSSLKDLYELIRGNAIVLTF